MKLPPFDTPGGRQAWAFLAIWGGAIVFTAFAAVGVWLVRSIPGLSFWLALAAHVQILVGMTALGWAMGRRVNVSAGKDGVRLDDSEDEPIRDGDTIKVERAE